MGHSTADIPTALLMPAAKDDFLAWVHDLPVHVSVKRYLMTTWSRAVDIKLRAPDYDFALGTRTLGMPDAT